MNYDNCRTVMIRFGEIFLKSEPVRRDFLNRLRSNIILAFESDGSFVEVSITRSRIFVQTNSEFDPVPLLSRIFGIVDFSPVTVTGTSIDEICSAATELAKKHLKPFTHFAVRARRDGIKDYSSQELAAEAGSRIIDVVPDLTVDLTVPEYEVFLEARKEGGIIYDTRIKGPGGLPYGTQGKALSLISAGIDSPVAAWLMMRRGVKIVFLNIDSGGCGGIDIRKNLTNNIEALSRWAPGQTLNLITLPAENFYKHLMTISEPRYRCVICKRFMLEIASMIAEIYECEGIITGDNLGQVATQTLQNLTPISAGIKLPIYRPLIGYDKEEIISLARNIDTFCAEPGDTSCKVLPPKPATRSEFDRIEKIMNNFGIRSFIPLMLENGVKTKINSGCWISK
jgi:tRNA uracil 4-sulfurtransferase